MNAQPAAQSLKSRASNPLAVVIGLTLSLLAATLFAQSAPAPLVNPGQWEITPQSNAGASVSYSLCFARGDLDDLKKLLPNLSNTTECPAQRINATDGVMTWDLDCPAKSFRGEGRYALSAMAVDGTIHFTQGAPAVTATQRIIARRAGACPAQ